MLSKNYLVRVFVMLFAVGSIGCAGNTLKKDFKALELEYTQALNIDSLVISGNIKVNANDREVKYDLSSGSEGCVGEFDITQAKLDDLQEAVDQTNYQIQHTPNAEIAGGNVIEQAPGASEDPLYSLSLDHEPYEIGYAFPGKVGNFIAPKDLCGVKKIIKKWIEDHDQDQCPDDLVEIMLGDCSSGNSVTVN